MERYEIAKSEAEREKDYEKIVKYLREHGIKEDWKISSLIEVKESDFGLNNNFPILSEHDDEVRDRLFVEREMLIGKYNRLRAKLEPMIVLEREIWFQLGQLNKMICEKEGHRLSEKSTCDYEPDDYGHHQKIGYYRTCLVCGKRVYEAGLKYNDVVVKGEEGPKRILYK